MLSNVHLRLEWTPQNEGVSFVMSRNLCCHSLVARVLRRVSGQAQVCCTEGLEMNDLATWHQDCARAESPSCLYTWWLQLLDIGIAFGPNSTYSCSLLWV